ncbi:MAG: CPBP family intramembrane glutamic endopeptidase [Planctomycetota bacterium]|nr:CPBP family intramembrane glutamic endopeptidase [Planctomycetota bacterium]
MDHPPGLPPTSVWIILGLASWLCVSVWVVVGSRLWNREPVLPLARRRQVPWSGFDLLFVFAFFVLASGLMFAVIGHILGPNADEPAAGVGIAGVDVETSHAIVQLFRGGNPWMILFCVVSAVVVAPIVEEFLFRVLLQGWLERMDRQLRPMLPVLRRLVPWGVAPLVLSSLVFAMVHFRVASPPMNTRYLLSMMVGNSLVGISTSVFAILLLRIKNGATASDLGFAGGKFPQDVCLGLAAAAGVIFPVFILQAVMTAVLPKWIAADPLPLFCFAVALGFLYCRTHRVVASIVLHMSLNATSLVMLWFYMLG